MRARRPPSRRGRRPGPAARPASPPARRPPGRGSGAPGPRAPSARAAGSAAAFHSATPSTTGPADRPRHRVDAGHPGVVVRVLRREVGEVGQRPERDHHQARRGLREAGEELGGGLRHGDDALRRGSQARPLRGRGTASPPGAPERPGPLRAARRRPAPASTSSAANSPPTTSMPGLAADEPGGRDGDRLDVARRGAGAGTPARRGRRPRGRCRPRPGVATCPGRRPVPAPGRSRRRTSLAVEVGGRRAPGEHGAAGSTPPR